jgi:uracil-DNA glycosylase family 4
MARKRQSTGGRAVRAMTQKLESLERAGVTHLPRRRRTESPASTAQGAAATPSPGAQAAASEQAGDRAAALAALRREVAACTRCQELARHRTQTVFGAGDPHSRLVFLGEAPGYDEDAQGEPFVGAAGQLLNRIIQACTLRREEVYILNILKCHPPGNRNPLAGEAANCREYLDRQLAIIRPEFICCLGAVAAQNLLETTAPIGRLRGRWYDYHGIKVLCTYHPAYLLRTPAAKKQAWEDMQRLMAEMGISLPKS